MEDESNGVGATEETRKALLSLSEAAAKIVPSDLQAFLKEENVCEILLDTFVKIDNTQNQISILSLFVIRLCRRPVYGAFIFTLREHFPMYHHNG